MQVGEHDVVLEAGRKALEKWEARAFRRDIMYAMVLAHLGLASEALRAKEQVHGQLLSTQSPCLSLHSVRHAHRASFQCSELLLVQSSMCLKDGAHQCAGLQAAQGPANLQIACKQLLLMAAGGCGLRTHAGGQPPAEGCRAPLAVLRAGAGDCAGTRKVQARLHPGAPQGEKCDGKGLL